MTSGPRRAAAACALVTLGLSPTIAAAQAQEWRTEGFKRTVTIGPRGALDLSNIAGQIIVTTGGGDKLVIEAVKRVPNSSDAIAQDLFSRVTIDVAQRAGRVIVRTLHAPMPNRKWVAVDYHVVVPRDTTVELRSISGNIELRDVRGEARIQSFSGDVRLVNAANLGLVKTVTGNIDLIDSAGFRHTSITTMGGNLRVRNLKTPRVEASAVSGTVELLDVQCDRLDARSVTGAVQFRGSLSRRGRYELYSHSGNLQVAVASDGFDVEAHTFNGTIQTQFPIQAPANFQRSRLQRSQILRGAFQKGGAVLALRTFSGNVTIERK